MAKNNSVLIWPWWLRVCHWLLVLVFILNYFLLEPGSDLHQWFGYGITALIAGRILLGFFHLPGYAAFATCHLRWGDFKHHAVALKHRHLPVAAGHNPLGWLMVFFFWFLVFFMAVTGFLAEEIDYFFGNQILHTVHSIAADAMFVAAILHIVAVILVGFWGRVALIKPMITGVRKNR